MKRSNALVVILAAVLTLCSWGGAWAMDRAGTVSFSPMFGGCWFQGDQHLKVSPAYGLALGYNIDEHLGVELGGSFINARSKHGYTGDVDTWFYHLDGLYHLTPVGNFQPYGGLGLGGMTFNFDNRSDKNRSHTAVAFNYGGGFEYFIVDDFALRGDVRHVITFDGGHNDLLFTAGLTFFFGGKTAGAAPPPPPAPEPERKVEAPAPTPPPAPKRQEAYCIVLKVEFDFDKDNVKPEYNDEIKRVADFLQANPAFKGTIEGGTDAVGSDKYNQELSMRRAESVKKYLVDNFNIAPARLSTVGFGRAIPVDTNLTEEGRARNRRAVRVYCSSGEDLPPPMKARKCIILKVEFAVGSSVVDGMYDDGFKEMAEYMKENPAYVGTIEGYADATGSDEYNEELSVKRAESVKKRLVDDYGIPAERLNTIGIGSRRPINSNETPEGRAANRYAVQVICEPE